MSSSGENRSGLPGLTSESSEPSVVLSLALSARALTGWRKALFFNGSSALVQSRKQFKAVVAVRLSHGASIALPTPTLPRRHTAARAPRDAGAGKHTWTWATCDSESSTCPSDAQCSHSRSHEAAQQCQPVRVYGKLEPGGSRMASQLGVPVLRCQWS